MSLFRNIERRIDDRLRRLFQSEPVPGQGRELVEIQRMVLDQIDARVQQAALVRHLLLLPRQIVDELLQLLVRHVRKVGKRFQRDAFRRGSS